MNETTLLMTPDIAAAVCKVMGQVKTLAKGDKNKFDGYNFASIDKFLEFVNPLCADAGIFVVHQEIAHEFYENKKGSLWMRVDFAFYLCHSSGAMCGPFNRQVAVPMTGAQSFGSAQSYALKQFLRAQFMIPTGEKDDADHNAKDEHQAAPPIRENWRDPAHDDAITGVKGVKVPHDASEAEKAKAYADGIINQFAEVKTPKGMPGAWDRNQRIIDRLETKYPDLYADVLDAFMARQKALAEEGTETAGETV